MAAKFRGTTARSATKNSTTGSPARAERWRSDAGSKRRALDTRHASHVPDALERPLSAFPAVQRCLPDPLAIFDRDVLDSISSAKWQQQELDKQSKAVRIPVQVAHHRHA